MAANYLTYFTFALVCLAILILPFVPAFREWMRPTDLAALPIAANYTNDIDHFSSRLQGDVAAKLGVGEATGYEDFEFVTEPFEQMDWQTSSKRLISRNPIQTATRIRSKRALYVEGDIHAGTDCAFTALYAAGDIALGAQSEIHDWAHADGTLRLSTNCVALRRVSAGESIELGDESWFERVHAPTVYFGSVDRPLPTPMSNAQEAASFADLPNVVQQTPALFMVRGDCALPAGKTYQGSLVVTGFLTIAAGTTVVGDVKAREGASIGPGAYIQGALTCEKRIYVFGGAGAWGPLVSESDVLIGSGAVVGLPEALTTVNARNIIAENGAVVHGTIWAHEIGMVKPK